MGQVGYRQSGGALYGSVYIDFMDEISETFPIFCPEIQIQPEIAFRCLDPGSHEMQPAFVHVYA